MGNYFKDLWNRFKAGMALLWEKFVDSSPCDFSEHGPYIWPDGGWPRPSDEPPKPADSTDLPHKNPPT